VGASGYYSEIATTQTLDNLRAAGVLDVVQYLERVPEKLIPKKAELIAELKKRAADGAQTQPDPAGAAGGPNVLGALPESVQARYADLPGTAKRALQKREEMR